MSIIDSRGVYSKRLNVIDTSARWLYFFNGYPIWYVVWLYQLSLCPPKRVTSWFECESLMHNWTIFSKSVPMAPRLEAVQQESQHTLRVVHWRNQWVYMLGAQRWSQALPQACLTQALNPDILPKVGFTLFHLYPCLHQQTLGALPGSTVVLIDGIVIHSTYSVCRNIYELRSAPVVLL